MEWPALLRGLLAGDDLGADDARGAIATVLAGEATPAQIAGFLVALRSKGVTADELVAMVDAMYAAAQRVEVPDGLDPVDTCGTGGSPQRREGCFNVGSVAALVAAGAGVAVCKHGGRAATATSSSADCFAELGVAVELPAPGVERCLREVGIAFCFAPVFHPAMRHAAPVRRELGIPTVFNLLGPLSNPAAVRRQVLGVADLALAETVAEVLRVRGATRAMVVTGADGLDELTTTTTSTVVEVRDGAVGRFTVDPAALGLSPVTAAQLRGGDAAANAGIARRVLAGEPGPHRDIVVLNAAAAVVVAGLADDLESALPVASAAIDSGAAAAVLDRLVKVSQAAAAST